MAIHTEVNVYFLRYYLFSLLFSPFLDIAFINVKYSR